MIVQHFFSGKKNHFKKLLLTLCARIRSPLHGIGSQCTSVVSGQCLTWQGSPVLIDLSSCLWFDSRTEIGNLYHFKLLAITTFLFFALYFKLSYRGKNTHWSYETKLWSLKKQSILHQGKIDSYGMMNWRDRNTSKYMLWLRTRQRMGIMYTFHCACIAKYFFAESTIF